MPGCRPLMFAALLILGGCAGSGIEAGGDFPSKTFDVNTPYDAAYRRAGEFVRICHTAPEYPYGVQYRDTRNLDEKFATAQIVVFKSTEPTVHLEVMEIKPKDKSKTDSTVTVTVLGKGMWDARELDSAEKSIQSATPICRDPQG